MKKQAKKNRKYIKIIRRFPFRKLHKMKQKKNVVSNLFIKSAEFFMMIILKEKQQPRVKVATRQHDARRLNNFSRDIFGCFHSFFGRTFTSHNFSKKQNLIIRSGSRVGCNIYEGEFKVSCSISLIITAFSLLPMCLQDSRSTYE